MKKEIILSATIGTTIGFIMGRIIIKLVCLICKTI